MDKSALNGQTVGLGPAPSPCPSAPRRRRSLQGMVGLGAIVLTAGGCLGLSGLGPLAIEGSTDPAALDGGGAATDASTSSVDGASMPDAALGGGDALNPGPDPVDDDASSPVSATDAGGISDAHASADAPPVSSNGDAGGTRPTDSGPSSSAASMVFVTSAEYTGNLGGAAGADKLCQSEASNAGVAGTFRAWISDAKSSPSTRFSHPLGDYRLRNGAVVAGDWAELVQQGPRVPINVAADGTVVGATAAPYAWTNTANDGTSLPASQNGISLNCTGFTKATAGGQTTGVAGDVLSTATWTEGSSYPFDCSSRLRLYCFASD